MVDPRCKAAPTSSCRKSVGWICIFLHGLSRKTTEAGTDKVRTLDLCFYVIQDRFLFLSGMTPYLLGSL